jgi:hypothetical protein
MIGTISALKPELNAQQEAFLGRLLLLHDVHADDVEIELVETDRQVQEVELILPPGCRSVAEMHDRIERLIWVPGCGD